jgi:anti-anti-sigma factor
VSDQSPERTATGPDARDVVLTLQTRADGREAVIVITGELDMASAPDFEREAEAVLATPVDRLVLDLAGLGFLDSSGIAVFHRADRRMAERGGQLILDHVPASIQRILELCGMADAFTIRSR